jgi:hypothetical protein
MHVFFDIEALAGRCLHYSAAVLLSFIFVFICISICYIVMPVPNCLNLVLATSFSLSLRVLDRRGVRKERHPPGGEQIVLWWLSSSGRWHRVALISQKMIIIIVTAVETSNLTKSYCVCCKFPVTSGLQFRNGDPTSDIHYEALLGLSMFSLYFDYQAIKYYSTWSNSYFK